MFRRFSTIASLLFIGLAFSGCSGDTGPTGPAGPTGDTGLTGDPETANVMFSAWFTPSTYTLTSPFGVNVLSHDEAAAQVTQAILDTGVVLVFGKLNGYSTTIWPTDQVGQLPISVQYIIDVIQLDVWSANLSVGNVQIAFMNNMNLYTSLFTAHEFRYVIIPGGVAAASSLSGTRLQDLSYEQIREIFGVPQTGSRF